MTGSPLETVNLLARREASDPNSPETISLRKMISLIRGDYGEFFRLDRLHPNVNSFGESASDLGRVFKIDGTTS